MHGYGCLTTQIEFFQLLYARYILQSETAMNEVICSDVKMRDVVKKNKKLPIVPFLTNQALA